MRKLFKMILFEKNLEIHDGGYCIVMIRWNIKEEKMISIQGITQVILNLIQMRGYSFSFA